MTEWSDENRLTDEECEQVLDRLFPQGLGGEDVLQEIAPQGWERSSFLAVFHPTVERLHEEAVRIHGNLSAMFRNREADSSKPPPTIDEIRSEYVDPPLDAARECLELVTRCLWDIFSDNHEVLRRDGQVVDLGSFRGSAAFLADWISRWSGEQRYDYMDFYMGTIWVAERADLTPIYRMIFRRLKAAGLDWKYYFPRIGVVDLRPLHDRPDEGTTDNYDPSEAFAREQERAESDQRIEELRQELDEGTREAARAAKLGPPPKTVLAYAAEFGEFPTGWPPEIE